MNTNDQNSENFMGQLFDLQQQYLKNIEQAFQIKQPSAEASDNPFDQWWNKFPKSGQGDFDSFFKQMSGVGMGFMNNPLENMQKQASQAQDMTNWFNSMNQQFTDWSKAGAGVNPVFDKMNEQLKQQFQSPFNMSSMPWMQNQFNTGNMSNPLNSSVLNLLQNLFNGEEKAGGEQLLESLGKYQEAMMKSNHLMAQVGIDSLNQLQNKMTQADGKNLEEIYQWWMQSSQEIFNREKVSEPFKTIQAELESLQKTLTKDYEKYRLGLVSNLGLVSRAEYDALKLQLDSLKAELSELKQKSSTTSSGSNDENNADQQDDFTVLKGVGDKFNDKLHEQGIHNLQQLASMSDEMLKNLDGDLQAKGRILQDQWREQAEQFLNKMTGKA